MDKTEKAPITYPTERDKSCAPSNVAQKQLEKHLVKKKRYKPKTTRLSRCKNGISKIDPKKFSCALPDISSPSKPDIAEKQPEVPQMHKIQYRPAPTNVVRYTMAPRHGQLRLTRYNRVNSLRPKALKVKNSSSPRKSVPQQGTVDGIARIAQVQTVVTKLAVIKDTNSEAEHKGNGTSAFINTPEPEILPSNGIRVDRIEAESCLPTSHMLNYEINPQSTEISCPFETGGVSNTAIESDYSADKDDDFLETLLWLHGEKDTQSSDLDNQADDDVDTEQWLHNLVTGSPCHDHIKCQEDSLSKAANTKTRMSEGDSELPNTKYQDSQVNNVDVLATEWSVHVSGDICLDESLYGQTDGVFDIEEWLDEQRRIITGEGCQETHLSGDESTVACSEIEDLCKLNVYETYHEDYSDHFDFSEPCNAAEQSVFPEIKDPSFQTDNPLTEITDDWLSEQGFDFSPVIKGPGTIEAPLVLPDSILWLDEDKDPLDDKNCQNLLTSTSTVDSIDVLNTELNKSDVTHKINQRNDSLDNAFKELLSELCLGEHNQYYDDGTSSNDNIVDTLNPRYGYVGGEDFNQSECSGSNTLEFLQPDIYYDLEKFLTDCNCIAELGFSDTYDFHNNSIEKVDTFSDPATSEEDVICPAESFGIDCYTDTFCPELDNTPGIVQLQDVRGRTCLPGINSKSCTNDERADLDVKDETKKDAVEGEMNLEDLEWVYLKGRLSIHTRRLRSEDVICRISCIFHEYTLNDDLTYRKSKSKDDDCSIYGTPEDETLEHAYVQDDQSCLPVSSSLYRLSAGHWHFDVPVF